MFKLLAAYSAAASSTYLIFIVIIFLGSSNNIFFHFSTTAGTTLQLNCYDYDYFSCGSTRYISYPFWKMDELQDQKQQQHCGYPGLGITCSPNGKLIINISNQSFYVLRIESSEQLGLDDLQPTIIDPDFVDTTCPKPRRNFTLNQVFSDSAIGVRSSNRELTFFLNCTSPPPPPLIRSPGTNLVLNRSHHLECLDYNNHTMRSYGFFKEELDYYHGDRVNRKILADWNGNYCKESVIVLAARNYSENDEIIKYIQALQEGFGVFWSTPVECEICESSGGFCSFSTNGKQQPISYKCWCKLESQLTYGADGRQYCLTLESIYYASNKNKNHGFAAALCNKILIGVFTGVGGLMLIITLLFIYRKNQRKRRRSIAQNVELFLESYGCRSSQRYKYKDIKKMTNSFKDKLGEGGYGSVFKGKLMDGRPVAVKVLINDPKKNTNGQDFMNEVATIGSTNHVNIVALLGFCSSGSKRALVYEFMPNGSLDKFIYAKEGKSTTTKCTSDTATITSTSSNEVVLSLGWEKLYQIALGIARGLEYLHRGCNIGRILHFDIKPHNILLDENFCPKISDFGLAKLCPTRESIVSMLSGGRGTLGYIAPEVYNRNFGGVSYKSDVYSYGMMMLEMVGGRKNIDPFVENTSEIYFPHWIYNHLEKDKDKIEGLLKFEEAFDEEMAKKMIMVGLWCIQTHQESRPSMSKVVDMLEGNVKDLQIPPNPSRSSSTSHILSLLGFLETIWAPALSGSACLERLKSSVHRYLGSFN